MLATIYGLLLTYGTLYPLSGWTTPAMSPWSLILAARTAYASRADMFTNVLVYLPLGLLLTHALARHVSFLGAVGLATVVGSLLSAGLEYGQAFLPSRVPSSLDITLNASGTFIGAVLAVGLRAETAMGRWLYALRRDHVQPGRLASLGLITLGLWVLSQLSPLIPSLDVGNLRQGLKPFWHTLRGTLAFDFAQASVYALSIVGLGVVAQTLLRPTHRKVVPFAGFCFAILLLKVPVVSRQLSLEAASGVTMALGLVGILGRMRAAVARSAAALALAGAVAVEALRPGADPLAPTASFNWIPFTGHLTNTLIGLADMLSGAWPFVGLSYLAIAAAGQSRIALALGGGFCVFGTVLLLEWHQQALPGRSPDITDAFVALFAWTLPWLYMRSQMETKRTTSTRRPPLLRPRHSPRVSRRAVAVVALALIGAAGAGIWAFGGSYRERPLDESNLPKLPGPDELPAVKLPGFHHQHPRLPTPTPSDIEKLQRENPGFFRQHAKRANGGRGNLYSVTLTALVAPGSQDLGLLYKRLMSLEFSWRGHKQAKPLAIGYDWLFDQWTVEQRTALQNKLAEGADYLIHRIREKQRLSPYNVYLYNSPFQALVAVTLALYGDHPRGKHAMRFTYDFWKHRVLPVWRQVMGKNGGWHEGGEYVGIGIGQAIYQVPAMWRAATGEDLFATEPGIRGFLDFLIYRTRPDGTHFRWGDAGFFNRHVPDRVPLAIEYRHAAGYSLPKPPKRLEPTAWPWGPLTEPTLADEHALTRLPLVHHFDGIGLIVARSNWTPQATYVTFKAGDNFWSHCHLDQGAFTIYKGGALAIDSGLYGPSYGADHHMNYTYQTIAHNTLTVTDPEDTVPAPSKNTPRAIANDGGQRRIGSGWGVEAAPLDRNEWDEKRGIYHTGTLKRVFMKQGFVVAVADLTPAYTDRYSGEGTFSHRTRRVERLTRSFAYDQREDVIVIFDRLAATKPEYWKRWLLHTIEEPISMPDGFIVTRAPGTRAGQEQGGRLEAHVLLPKQANIQVIGGPGFEFFVDGKNYDEDGLVQKKAQRKRDVEPGAWRVEVSPRQQAYEDTFLVVLLPSDGQSLPHRQVRSIEERKRVGCEVTGNQRTTRWWFDNEHDGPLIEVFIPDRPVTTYDLRVSGNP